MRRIVHHVAVRHYIRLRYKRPGRLYSSPLREGSYFSDPELTAEKIERFFVGARVLWATRPWTSVEDDELLRVDVPALGIHGGCVSIVGALDEVRGFVFFPSYQD